MAKIIRNVSDSMNVDFLPKKLLCENSFAVMVLVLPTQPIVISGDGVRATIQNISFNFLKLNKKSNSLY